MTTAIAFGFLSLCFIGLGIFFLWLRGVDLAEIAQWKQATACEAAGAGTSSACLADLNARISGVHPDARPPRVDLAVGSTGYHGDFYRYQLSRLAGFKTGDSIAIQVWRGKVVAVGEVPTQDNPNLMDRANTDLRYPLGLLIVGAVVGSATAYVAIRGHRPRLPNPGQTWGRS